MNVGRVHWSLVVVTSVSKSVEIYFKNKKFETRSGWLRRNLFKRFSSLTYSIGVFLTHDLNHHPPSLTCTEGGVNWDCPQRERVGAQPQILASAFVSRLGQWTQGINGTQTGCRTGLSKKLDTTTYNRETQLIILIYYSNRSILTSLTNLRDWMTDWLLQMWKCVVCLVHFTCCSRIVVW